MDGALRGRICASMQLQIVNILHAHHAQRERVRVIDMVNDVYNRCAAFVTAVTRLSSHPYVVTRGCQRRTKGKNLIFLSAHTHTTPSAKLENNNKYVVALYYVGDL